jgi:myo-inositol 2-dehydrogenase / D-chiro-inositol 1-dehydrogenase
MPHKIGIVGAGGVAEIHAAILRKDARVKLGSFFDIDKSRAQALAVRCSGHAADSLEEVFEQSDAVFICTPNTTHEEVATQVLDARKHVFCEKPFALNLESATRLRDRAARAGVVYQVGHNRRFAPVYKILKEAIEQQTASSLRARQDESRRVSESSLGVECRPYGRLFI